MKKQYVFYFGILAFVAGILLIIFGPELAGAMEYMPFILIGIGAGIVGVGMVYIFREKMYANDPEKAKQYEIEEKDERNIRIREKAAYATWYVSLLTLSVLSLTCLLLGYTVPCFLVLGVLFIQSVSLLVFISVYNKRI